MADTEEQIREGANELLNACVSYAKRMLRKFGEFGPFGYRLNEEGEAVMERVAGRELPADAALLLDLLRTQLVEKAQKGILFAAATASNVTMAKPSEEGYSDAILIEIEHRSNYSVRAFVPYRITGGQLRGFFPRVVRFGALRTQDAEAKLFAHSSRLHAN